MKNQLNQFQNGGHSFFLVLVFDEEESFGVASGGRLGDAGEGAFLRTAEFES